MNDVLRVTGVFLFGCVVLAGIYVAGGFLGLWWYPYAIQRQTAIVRASNSYVTTKQQELMTMYVGYTTATAPEQRRAILAQMCQDAALIPDYVPPLVGQTIAGGCGR